MRRRSRLAGTARLALLPLILLIFTSCIAPRGTLDSRLVDLTGETDRRQQLQGLLLATVPIKQADARTADFVPVRPTGGRPFGVNTFLQWQPSPERFDRSFDLLQEAGVTWIRQQFPWSDIEIPSKGQYVNSYGRSTWEKYDRMVDLAEAHGIRILARLDFPPDWARQDNQNTFAPPDHYEDYGDFVETVARRYQGRIFDYQIWNEPNTDAEWGPYRPNSSEYTRLLRTAAQRLRAVDPRIVVHAAALAPTLGTPDGKNVADLDFLQGMYDAGAAQWFDVMGVMAYGLWTGPGDRRLETGRVNFSRPQLIRDVMVRNGDARKPLWAAEVGWNALPEDWPDPPTHGQVSLELQAKYAREAYQRAIQEWPWMGVMFYWHFGLPYDENRDQQMFYFRMADPDLTKMPVFDSFEQAATAPGIVGTGRHYGDHWAIQTQGAAAKGASQTLVPAGSRATWLVDGASFGVLLAAPGPASTGLLTLRAAEEGATSAAIDQQPIALPAGSAPTYGTVLRPPAPGKYRITLETTTGSIVLHEVAVYQRTIAWQFMILGGLVIVVALTATGLALRRQGVEHADRRW